MINPMRILVRLVPNWKCLETISRFCAILSAIGCMHISWNLNLSRWKNQLEIQMPISNCHVTSEISENPRISKIIPLHLSRWKNQLEISNVLQQTQWWSSWWEILAICDCQVSSEKFWNSHMSNIIQLNVSRKSVHLEMFAISLSHTHTHTHTLEREIMENDL